MSFDTRLSQLNSVPYIPVTDVTPVVSPIFSEDQDEQKDSQKEVTKEKAARASESVLALASFGQGAASLVNEGAYVANQMSRASAIAAIDLIPQPSLLLQGAITLAGVAAAPIKCLGEGIAKLQNSTQDHDASVKSNLMAHGISEGDAEGYVSDSKSILLYGAMAAGGAVALRAVQAARAAKRASSASVASSAASRYPLAEESLGYGERLKSGELPGPHKPSIEAAKRVLAQERMAASLGSVHKYPTVEELLKSEDSILRRSIELLERRKVVSLNNPVESTMILLSKSSKKEVLGVQNAINQHGPQFYQALKVEVAKAKIAGATQVDCMLTFAKTEQGMARLAAMEEMAKTQFKAIVSTLDDGSKMVAGGHQVIHKSFVIPVQ